MAGIFGGFNLPLLFKGTYNTEIVVGENEAAESAIRRFRRSVMQAGVIPEVRRRRYFETPQDIKKRKEANKHARKRQARQQQQQRRDQGP